MSLLGDDGFHASGAAAEEGIAAEQAGREKWLKDNTGWLLEAFAEANPAEWARFLEDAWWEHIGEAE